MKNYAHDWAKICLVLLEEGYDVKETSWNSLNIATYIE